METIGIYKITNCVNKKVYIGQSWNIERRWASESCGNSINQYLKRSFQKHGKSNFSFEVLKSFDNKKEKEELIKRKMNLYEQIYIEIYESTLRSFGYNLKKGGWGGGKLTEEERKKKGRPKELHPLWGKHHSYETRQRISKAHLGKKANMKAIQLMVEKNKKRIFCSTNNTIYSSAKEAGIILGLDQHSIGRVARKEWTHTHGWKFEFI